MKIKFQSDARIKMKSQQVLILLFLSIIFALSSCDHVGFQKIGTYRECKIRALLITFKIFYLFNKRDAMATISSTQNPFTFQNILKNTPGLKRLTFAKASA